MKWMRNNKGSILVTVALVVLGVAIGLMVYGLHFGAEAVVGGQGNLTLSNNPHNFASNSTGVKALYEDEICIFCHTPHNAIKGDGGAPLLNAPLWNHSLSSATYTLKSVGNHQQTTPTVYNVALLSTPQQPDGTSRLCLSCHDGTVGIGQLNTGYIQMDTSTSCINASEQIPNTCNAYLGTDLAAINKHVVSVPMNNTLITNSAAQCMSMGGTWQTYKVVYPWDNTNVNSQPNTVILRPTSYQYSSQYGATTSTATPAMPANNKYKPGYSYGVQCSTCHDPHYWSGTSGTAGWKFIVTATVDALCLACHVYCGP